MRLIDMSAEALSDLPAFSTFEHPGHPVPYTLVKCLDGSWHGVGIYADSLALYEEVSRATPKLVCGWVLRQRTPWPLKPRSESMTPERIAWMRAVVEEEERREPGVAWHEWVMSALDALDQRRE